MDDHLNNLYQANFHRWLGHQAELLRAAFLATVPFPTQQILDPDYFP